MTIHTASGRDIEFGVNALAPNITVLGVSGNYVSNLRTKKLALMPSAMPEKVIQDVPLQMSVNIS